MKISLLLFFTLSNITPICTNMSLSSQPIYYSSLIRRSNVQIASSRPSFDISQIPTDNHSYIVYDIDSGNYSIKNAFDNYTTTRSVNQFKPADIQSENFPSIAPGTVEEVSNPSNYPYSNILAFHHTLINGIYQDPYTASAFFVDSYLAMTAAHCVFKDGNFLLDGGFVLNEFTIDAIYMEATKVIIDTQYIHDEDDYRHDWAFIVFDEPYGDLVGWNPLFFNDTPPLYDQMFALGYPGTTSKLTKYDGEMLGVNDKTINFDAKVLPGTSGGPIFNSYNEVIGIISGAESNENVKRGTRLTQKLYEVYNLER